MPLALTTSLNPPLTSFNIFSNFCMETKRHQNKDKEAPISMPSTLKQLLSSSAHQSCMLDLWRETSEIAVMVDACVETPCLQSQFDSEPTRMQHCSWRG